MDLNNLLDTVIVLASLISLGALLYFYYTNAKVRTIINAALQYMPMLLTFAQRFVKDDRGKFDTYDALEIAGRLTAKLQSTISDPTNKTFEDVETEIVSMIAAELANYRNLPGVPDINGPEVQALARVVFDAIQRASSEDSA